MHSEGLAKFFVHYPFFSNNNQTLYKIGLSYFICFVLLLLYNELYICKYWGPWGRLA